MKNLKNLLAGIILTAALMIGTGTAQAGLLVSDFSGNTPQPCTETQNKENVNSGILVTLTGVIENFTGILVTLSDNTPVNCGILLGD